MTTIIPLRIHGLTMSDDDVAFSLYEQWGAELQLKNEVTILSLVISDPDVVAAVAELIAQITLEFPTIVFDSVDRDLVSLSDIADRIGVTKEAVRKWTHLTTTPFPTQFATIGADQKIWDWIDVHDWLVRIKNFNPEEECLPTRTQIIGIDAFLAGVSTDLIDLRVKA